MKLLFILITFFISSYAMAVGCDCEVRVYSPQTGSIDAEPLTLKTLELEEFGSYSIKSQRACQKLCVRGFKREFPRETIAEHLENHTKSLIESKMLGFNCTGFTTLKYPVRVKAKLGLVGLGNVVDFVHVVTHEQVCF